MTDTPPVTASLFPVLGSPDAPATLRWLEEAFGFTGQAVHASEDGRIVHAELRYGNGIVMLASHRDAPDNPWARIDTGLYVAVDDIDAHHARARAAGAEIITPLRATGYGAREYTARDLDGRLWSFGTYRP